MSLAFRLHSLSVLTNRCLPPSSLVPARGKKTAKKQKKSRKDAQKDAMKEYRKQLEVREALEQVVLQAARRGEPMDPEMFNPARKRSYIQPSEEEREKRILLMKEWSRYTMQQHKQELQQLQGMMKTREHALKELRKLSLPLYKESLELRKDIFPFKRIGPVATPPKDNYIAPDPDSELF
ncbi:PREDICTED: 39S ribosomal protein L40, mitochondrial-like [Amphimedon queenslandica]|uniref:Large ribosomal subunit protein mL40 n=2 Tax=Amphimedon queenslandica TaxID=400682 RepID=A0AAN0J972_AMPQE|nr:PREDICTED: 39S ribosomal protein L40, mitochondrial-like [Amphimedon queenslandica]|eukprot:XP_019853276.1 PREDICTED: 39S ribosomal protein L40, mitochondrial-like [Amphimedon queenslandica]